MLAVTANALLQANGDRKLKIDEEITISNKK